MGKDIGLDLDALASNSVETSTGLDLDQLSTEYKTSSNLFSPRDVELFYQGNVPGVIDYINKNKPNGVEAAKFDDKVGEIVVRKGQDWFKTGMKAKGDKDQSIEAGLLEPKEAIPVVTSGVSSMYLGAQGAAAGAVVGGPVGAVIGGAAGALAGGTLGYQGGQALRRYAGSKVGVYKLPENETEFSLAFSDLMEGAQMEAYGQAAGPIIGKMADAGMGAVKKAASFVKGIKDKAWDLYENIYVPLGVSTKKELEEEAAAYGVGKEMAESKAAIIEKTELPESKAAVEKTQNTLRTIKASDRTVTPSNVLDDALEAYTELEAKQLDLEAQASRVAAAEKEALEIGKMREKEAISEVKGRIKDKREAAIESAAIKQGELSLTKTSKKAATAEGLREAKLAAKEKAATAKEEVSAQYGQDVGSEMLASKDKYARPEAYLSDRYAEQLAKIEDPTVLNQQVELGETANSLVDFIEESGIAVSQRNKRNPDALMNVQSNDPPTQMMKNAAKTAMHGLGVDAAEGTFIAKQLGFGDDDVSYLFGKKSATVSELRKTLSTLNGYERKLSADRQWGTPEYRFITGLTRMTREALYNSGAGGEVVKTINATFSQAKKVMELAQKEIINSTAEALTKKLESSKGPEIKRIISSFRKYVDPEAFPYVEKLGNKITEIKKIEAEYAYTSSKIRHAQRMAEQETQAAFKESANKIRLARAQEVRALQDELARAEKGIKTNFSQQAAQVRGAAEQRLSEITQELSKVQAEQGIQKRSLVSRIEREKEILKLQQEQLKLEKDYAKRMEQAQDALWEIIPKDKTNGKVAGILALGMGGGIFAWSKDFASSLVATGAAYGAASVGGDILASMARRDITDKFYSKIAKEIWEGNGGSGLANAVKYYEAGVAAGVLEKNKMFDRYIGSAKNFQRLKMMKSAELNSLRNMLYQAIVPDMDRAKKEQAQ